MCLYGVRSHGLSSVKRASLLPALCLCLLISPMPADGQTLTETLHAHARAGNLAAVQAVVHNGAQVNARDAYGWTAIMLAGTAPETEGTQPLATVLYLLEIGADPNARSIDGWSPLHFAAALGDDPQVALALLHAGAELEARTMESWSAEMSLTRYLGEQRLQRALGPGPQPGGNTGYTPLLIAARFGRPQQAVALLNAGAQASAQDDRGQTACHYAGENPLFEGHAVVDRLCY